MVWAIRLGIEFKKTKYFFSGQGKYHLYLLLQTQIILFLDIPTSIYLLEIAIWWYHLKAQLIK